MNKNQSDDKEMIKNMDKEKIYWPTNFMSPDFWEELGRTVATFGQLEFILKRTLISLPLKFTKEQFKKEREKIEIMATSSLNDLVKKLEDYSQHIKVPPPPPSLFENLHKAIDRRNILSHGAWEPINSKAYPQLLKRDKSTGIKITDKNIMQYDTELLRTIRTTTRDIIYSCVDLVAKNGKDLIKIR